MRSLLLAAALMLATAPAAMAGLFRDNRPLFTEASSKVVTVDDDNYAQMLASENEVWIVDFYAPWCPHCRQFAPEWEKVARFYENSATVHVGAVDCTKNNDVCILEEVKGYPAIKMYHVPKGTTKTKRLGGMGGRRTMQNIVEWAEKAFKEAGMPSGIGGQSIEKRMEMVRHGVIAEGFGDDADKSVEQSMTMKFRHLQDAGAAAIFTLENGFFMGTTVLEGERYEAALEWIEALAASFPMQVNRDVFASLAVDMRKRALWDHSSWQRMLDQWKEEAQRTTFPNTLLVSNEEQGWAHCHTYTCGLWTLFHSMSVSTTSTWKPSAIAAAIRLFIMHFFGCEECVKHFMQANPLSKMEELAESDTEGTQAVTLWLWKMHNIVNRVTKRPIWPSVVDCHSCYAPEVEVASLDPANLRPDHIAAFMQNVYNHQDADIWSMRYATRGFSSSVMETVTDFGSSSMLLVCVVGACAVALRTQRSRFGSLVSLLQREHSA